MADAMETEDSSSDTVEYDITTNQDDEHVQLINPVNQFEQAQPEMVNPRVITETLPQVGEVPRFFRVPVPTIDISELPSIESTEQPHNTVQPDQPHIVENHAVVPPTIQPQLEQPSTSSERRQSSERKQSFEDDDDGTTCPICLESWTNSGDHRICALKCGHLFGYNCVQRWLDSQSSKSCPTCKKKVRRTDLRFIYAKKLVAVDNIELEAVKDQLQEALAEKNKAAQELSRYISRECVWLQEIQQLKKKIQDLTIGSKPTDLRLSQRNPVNRIRLYMDKNLDICTQNDCRECRVFDINVSHNLASIATRSSNTLFVGFGLREIDLQSYKNVRFVYLHRAPIRDVSFHESNPWILSASTDKSFKVTDLHGNAAIHSVNVGVPLWSCCWDPNNEHHLFLGAQNGTVSLYDLRNTNQPLSTLSVEGDFSPVVSVAGVKSGLYSDIPLGGMLACKLNSVWAFEKTPLRDASSYSRYLLPLEGPFMSLRYDNKTRQLLVSARPNNQMTYVRHSLGSLEKKRDPDNITCNIVHTFRSGSLAKYLVRGSCFVPNDYVAGLHEARKSVILYSINTGDEVTSMPAHSAVLDLKGFEAQNSQYLAALTEKKLEFFKFSTGNTV